MSTSTPITLYDIPTKKPQYGSWSPNVWKSRLVLNYKQLPYTTQWLLHHDIAPTLSGAGIAPNTPLPPPPPPSSSSSSSSGPTPPQPSPYTVPAIILPSGAGVMESTNIAVALEALQPEPSLQLEKGVHQRLMPVLGRVMLPLLGVLFPRIGRDVLVDEVAAGWRAKREGQFGMTVEEFERAKGGETAWEGAEPGIVALRRFMREGKEDEGPFLLGSRVCYGDFVVVAMLESMRRIGEDVYERVLTYDEDGDLKRLHEACAKWLENDQ